MIDEELAAELSDEGAAPHVEIECIAICLCSCGLVHSRTMEAIHANIGNADHALTALLLTHDLPIPEAQNEIAQSALISGANYLWFVEEDMGFPEDALAQMLTQIRSDEDLQAVMATYRLRGGTMAHAKHRDGKLLYCGLGCTLVQASVFVNMEPPWFRIEKRYSITDTGLVPDVDNPHAYGGHDVDFCYQMSALHMRFDLAGFKAQHFYLEEWGERASNQGCHKIILL